MHLTRDECKDDKKYSDVEIGFEGWNHGDGKREVWTTSIGWRRLIRNRELWAVSIIEERG